LKSESNWRQAIQQLEDAIEQNSEHPNVEKIRLMRIAMFGDIDAMEKSGDIQLPKRKT
jgi:hypothetical protein